MRYAGKSLQKADQPPQALYPQARSCAREAPGAQHRFAIGLRGLKRGKDFLIFSKTVLRAASSFRATRI
jgi:hypothetical protein